MKTPVMPAVRVANGVASVQRYTRILGTGSYLPERVITNDELSQQMDTNDEWIVSRTGIRERRIAAIGETNTQLATAAARQALNAANISATQLDLIIVATTTADLAFPSVACEVQEALGANECPAFDLAAACSGSVYALTVANAFILSGQAKQVLIIGSEVMSRLIDWTDRNTCILFGDGAGAMVLGASDEPGVLYTSMHSNGCYKDLLYAHMPWDREDKKIYIKMLGREIFRLSVEKVQQVVDDTLRESGIDKSEVDWFIPHQANLRIIEAMAKKLHLPMERVLVTLDVHANTSAASVFIALDTGIRDGRVKRGETLLLESFGAGFTWASALVIY